MDLEHEESRGSRPQPGPPSPDPGSGQQDDGQARANSFGRLYDIFIFLVLAFSVLEMLMFHLGKRQLAAAANRRGGRGSRSFMSTGGLESLLDEDDLRQVERESWSGESVQEVGGLGSCSELL